MVEQDAYEHPPEAGPMIRKVELVEFLTRHLLFAVYISDNGTPVLAPLTSSEHHILHRVVVVDLELMKQHTISQDAGFQIQEKFRFQARHRRV